jgi:hypothetical protein
MGKPQGLPKSRFLLRAFWFVRGLNIIRKEEHPIPDLAALRRSMRPYRRRQSVALYLDRDDFETGGVWAHFTGDRAWLAHFDCPGGADSYAHDPRFRGPRMACIGFRLNNGQVDDIHPAWTVTREKGIKALGYFFLHGERDPNLLWVEQPASLQKPPNMKIRPTGAASRRPEL